MLVGGVLTEHTCMLPLFNACSLVQVGGTCMQPPASRLVEVVVGTGRGVAVKKRLRRLSFRMPAEGLGLV